MGRQRVEDHRITPLTTITSLTPAAVVPNPSTAGVIPVGNYKGVPAFWDLDKAVNQPLIWAEQQHILGILDGRQANYDLINLAITLAEAIGTIHTGTLTVPAGQVWYVNAITMTVPASGGANAVTGQWFCSLWTDRVNANAAGQPFQAAAFNPGVLGGANLDEFGPWTTLLAVANKPPLLRLPAGAIITFVAINTVAVAAATVAATLVVNGFMGRQLVA
jgi:hypothetical protein